MTLRSLGNIDGMQEERRPKHVLIGHIIGVKKKGKRKKIW